MTNKTAVQNDSPGRRAAAYWFMDGLPEILFGLLLLIPIALALAARELRWQNRWLSAGFFAAYVFFYLLGYAIWFLYRPVLNYIKARITYPRTGYARPPDDFPDKRHPHYKILTLGTVSPADDNVSSFVSHTVPLICSGVFFMGFLKSTHWGLPLVTSGIAAGIYFLNRNGVRPYSWCAVLPIALAGLIAATFNLEPEKRWFMPLIICGAWLLGIGTWTLVRYLRAHPKPDAGQEGRL
jgi:hypothetical protein